MTILIDNEVPGRLHIPYRKIITEVVEGTLDYLEEPFEAEVSVTITDAGAIKEINKEHRGIDAATDVLSFPMNEYDRPGDFGLLEDAPDAFNPETGELMLGDIVICADRVISQAEEYGHTRKRELAFLVCHSVLHLCGFDHIEDDQREEMEKLQRTILGALGYKRRHE